MAKTTIENFVEPAIRLYEREPGEACASTRFGEYEPAVGQVGDRGVGRGGGIPAQNGAAAG